MTNPETNTPLQDEELSALVYHELHQIAHRCLRKDWGNNTWQTTDLLHEAWLRLKKYQGGFESHAHFLALAATCMHRILVGYAREKQALKRGGNWQQVSWSDTLALTAQDSVRVIELNEALTELQKIDETEFRVVVMFYFGAMKKTEIADVLGVTEGAVRKRLKSAQAWLQRYLEANS